MNAFGPITQLGYLTNDLDASVQLWTSVMGVGPFTKMTNVKMAAVIDGQDVEINIDLALAYMGEVQIELIQPLCDSPSPYLANKQAAIWGAHHTQFTVDDLDGAIRKCEAHCMELACEINSGGGRYIYMRGAAGWIELTSPNPHLEAFFAAIKQSCETWDQKTVWNILGG